MARRSLAHAVVLGLALFGAGCSSQPATEVNEYKIALKFIKDESLKPCEVLGPPPENNVGNLLQDYTDLSAVAAPCSARHNQLVEELRPIVEKARSAQ